MREELLAYCGGEIAIDSKVVPFEHVAHHARCDYSACWRGHHRSPNRAGVATTIRTDEYTGRRHTRQLPEADVHLGQDREAHVQPKSGGCKKGTPNEIMCRRCLEGHPLLSSTPSLV